MARSEFLLPFRENMVSRPISHIGLTITMIVSSIFVLISKNLLDITLIYILSLIVFISFKGRIFKTIRVVASAFVIIFFLGLPSFFLHQGSIILVIPFGKHELLLYSIGVFRSIFIWVRGLCSVSIVTLYTTTITMQQFFESLRSIFIPNILVTLILLILRYTPLLYEQGNEVKTAQELRGLSNASFKRKFVSASSRIGGTLISSVNRGSEVFEGMLLRGLENSELVKRSSVNWFDFIFIPIITVLFSSIAGGLIPWPI